MFYYQAKWKSGIKIRMAIAIGIAFLILCLHNVYCGKSVSAEASRLPDQIVLTWTDDPRTSQTIRWRTDSSVERGWIRYAEDTGGFTEAKPYRIIEARYEEISTPHRMVHSYFATLVDLIPGRKYLYQVGDGEYWSSVHQFRTETQMPGSFKFLIMGDSQSHDYGVWRNTLQKATEAHSDAAFLISMGDLVDVGQDYKEWEAWFFAGAGVLERFPLFPVVGNHECYTLSRRFSPPFFFTAQFVLPENGPAQLRRQVYSFDYGNAHFVVLDTQVGEQAQYTPDMLALQRDWLDKDLAATKQPWKFVLMHRPIYGNKANGLLRHLQDAFESIFEKHKVDVVFTAHDHVYARTWPIKNVVHIATGRTGTKIYPELMAKSWNEVFFNPIERPNYLVVTLEGSRMRIGALQEDGDLIDSFIIDKPAEISSLQ